MPGNESTWKTYISEIIFPSLAIFQAYLFGSLYFRITESKWFMNFKVNGSLLYNCILLQVKTNSPHTKMSLNGIKWRVHFVFILNFRNILDKELHLFLCLVFSTLAKMELLLTLLHFCSFGNKLPGFSSKSTFTLHSYRGAFRKERNLPVT